jgi:excinuclease ABC subunit C
MWNKVWKDDKDQLTYSHQYSESMQLVQDFFAGKTDGLKAELKSEIDKSIETQNFERAAKLRDIYKNMDQFSQKQTVIIETTHNGIVANIIQLDKKWIVVVVVLQKGKMIDVLRFTELVEEVDLEQIVLSLELEFWKRLKCFLSAWKSDYFYYSQDLKIDNKMWKELKLHFDRFVTSFIASESRKKDSVANDLLLSLQQRYDLTYYPYHIECLDISHFSWWWASGGLSCLQWGVSNKKGYRRYKIKLANWWDDYDSLREVILRRFKYGGKLRKIEKNWENVGETKEWLGSHLPDLFILDGAQKQLDVIKKLFISWKLDSDLLNHVQFASLWKGSARSSGQKIKGEKEKLYILKANKSEQRRTVANGSEQSSDFEFSIESFEFVYDQVDRVLILLRDEAHRFANAYRKKQMSMEIN